MIAQQNTKEKGDDQENQRGNGNKTITKIQ
jgi:hypothetical protein